MNCSAIPQLYIIQNPTESIKPDEQIQTVRYLISFKQIAAKGEKELG